MLRTFAGLLLLCALTVLSGSHASFAEPNPPVATLLASGLENTIGSTIGPDGALYVAEGAAGRISRVDPQTGAVTAFASGLPKMLPSVGIGGVMDVEFYGRTAYALVTLVSADVGGSDVDGIYRVDGPDNFTVIADIGKFAMDNPPIPSFFVPTGVQYAFEPYRDGFLVTDGHHNRVLQVKLDGQISELIAFDNIVPTGLSVSGTTVYMAEAGPVPHLPAGGKVVWFRADQPAAADVASGASLVVDVEKGVGGSVYALSQGPGVPDAPAGSPAQPDSGSLLRVNKDGTFAVLVDAIDEPTSLEVVGDTAYVVTLTGEVWKIDGLSKLSPIASTPPAVTPPSTGDGGLVHQTTTSSASLAALATAVLGLLALLWQKRMT